MALSRPHVQVMQTQFAKDNNPDAQTLQKLSERTGLSRRVIQVKLLLLTSWATVLINSAISFFFKIKELDQDLDSIKLNC